MLNAIQALFRGLSDAFRPWLVLAPWEAGIRIRMGKRVAVLQPGFNWRIPGIDRISVQTTRMRVSQLPTQTMTTHDNRTLVLGANVAYSIRDIRRLYDSLHHAEDTIRCLASEAIAETINDGRGLLTPRAVAMEASVLAAERLQRFGLGDVQINMTDFAFVRTYRLISDQRWGQSGDNLSVNSYVTAGPQ